jgi:hypothetical protein
VVGGGLLGFDPAGAGGPQRSYLGPRVSDGVKGKFGGSGARAAHALGDGDFAICDATSGRDEWLPLPIHRLVSIALRTTTQRKYSVDDEHDAKLL